ncbi:hypothetical protein J3D56_004245 [Erwinia persicina]|uniref:DUF2732 domain-containing protein n=1 Tax=Erwinia aeris TaxID=3239803 RepID=A0ABV4E281_9GAMM|nr:hypothetical protein [Erwinia persicina]MCP1440809.1 hypothetical protein [Erwinia persicina]
MTAEIMPIKSRTDHLSEVSAGLALLKMFHKTGGHNHQTIELIMAKMEDDLAKVQETINRR